MVNALMTRLANAEQRFVDYAKEVAGLTDAEARKAMREMRALNVLKLSANDGSFRFTHGAYAEADVIRRAASL